MKENGSPPDRLMAALHHLPHGPEFRFLDRLLELEEGTSGLGEYRVRGDEPFLRGHFPEAPLFPGVLLVEAAAQLAGVVALSDPARTPLADLRLTALKGIKIFDTARPGEVVRLRVRIIARLAALVQAAVRAEAADRLLMEGELTLSGRAAAWPAPGLQD